MKDADDLEGPNCESMDTHNVMAMKALSDDTVKNGLASIIFDMFMKGLGKSSETQL